jgi:hypothetical protein
MRRFTLYFIIVSIISTACNQHKQNISFHDKPSDEAEITTVIFNASVYPDTLYKQLLLEERSFGIQNGFKGVIKMGKNDQKKSDLESDSLKKELDTAKLYVLIGDSLLSLQKNHLQLKLKTLANLNSESTNDTILNDWFRGINISYKPGEFDLRNLNSKYKYTYTLISKFRRPKSKVFIVGTFSMSSIFFNKKRDRAFVYSTFVCGSLCGEGRDIYLAKRKGKWEIIRKITAWVS